MLITITGIALALVLVLVITPFVRRWAFKCGALDRPDPRKVHDRVMPRLGGLAVYISFVLAVLLTREVSPQVAGLIAGSTLIVLLGILDDTRGVSPRFKLAGQVMAALAIIPFGLEVKSLTNPLSDQAIALGWLAVPVTVLWLVSVTNAVNLIDGLDGLAGGTSCIAALTLAGVVWIDIHHANANGGTPGQWDALILALILAAAALGFLRYNFYPARIFLGDSGSMFLGFSLAALSVMGMAKSATFISIFVPIVILGIPILDTFFAIVRRYADHRPIFSPDREHLHHRLVELGLSHRQAVLCIYAVSMVLGLSAILLTILTPKEAVFLLVVLSTVAYIGANRIGVTGGRSRPGKGRATFVIPRNDQRSHRM